MSRKRKRWLERVDRPRRESPRFPVSDGPIPVPLVPFVPVRCPRCRKVKPITYGKREAPEGRVRYHTCQGCGEKFQSMEIDPTEIA